MKEMIAVAAFLLAMSLSTARSASAQQAVSDLALKIGIVQRWRLGGLASGSTMLVCAPDVDPSTHARVV
jgi:hypothetical protein